MRGFDDEGFDVVGGQWVPTTPAALGAYERAAAEGLSIEGYWWLRRLRANLDSMSPFEYEEAHWRERAAKAGVAVEVAANATLRAEALERYSLFAAHADYWQRRAASA